MVIALDSSNEVSVTTNLAVFSHTCTNTDLDGYLFVMVAGQSGLNFSTFNVAYAGKKMELLFEDNNSAAFVDLAVWGLKDPPAGTDFIGVGTGGASENMYIATASFTGVSQELPIETSNSASGTSTTPSVSVTTETDNAVVVDFMAGQLQLSDPTQDGSQTLIEKGQSPTGFQCGAGISYEAKATAGAVSMDWTLGISADWYHYAVALRPAGERMVWTGVQSITFS